MEPCTGFYQEIEPDSAAHGYVIDDRGTAQDQRREGNSLQRENRSLVWFRQGVGDAVCLPSETAERQKQIIISRRNSTHPRQIQGCIGRVSQAEDTSPTLAGEAPGQTIRGGGKKIEHTEVQRPKRSS
jgi:hypothetical protein